MKSSKQTSGFTIVELLIVIVIIGILAALAIVAYNGIQQRARESSLKTSLSQAKRKLEIYKVDNSTYPLTGNLSGAQITDSGDASYQYTSNGTTYCMTATSGNVSYQTTESTTASSGGCAGHGQGGSPAVTNLATNPSFESNNSNWNTIAGASISTVSSGQGIVSGSNALEINMASSNQSGTQLYVPNLVASTTYTASGSLTLLSGDPTSIGIRYGDGGGTRASQTISPVLGVGATRRVSLTFTTSANPVGHLQFWRNASGASASAIVRLDGVMIQQGSSSTGYGDGNTANWIWNGTTNNSTSTGPAQ